MMHTFTVSGYLALIVALLILVATPYVRPGAVVTFGAMLEETMLQRPVRVTIMVFWWWLGWHFLTGG